MKKSEIIIKSLLFTFLFILISLAIDFKNDYECSKMSYENFIKETKCKKYWRYRNG